MVGDGKYIKLWKKGQEFDQNRLDRYQEHQIETVYVAADDFAEFAETCLRVSEIVAKKNVPLERKFSILSRISSNVLQGLQTLNFDKEILGQSTTLVESMISSIGSNQEFDSLLKGLEGMGDEFVRESIACSAISILLARGMGWTNEKTLKNLGMAGLFHDIGFKELPPNIYKLRRVDMDLEQIKLYESHPERGAKILESVNGIPIEVIEVVRDHHEEASGMGFPRALKFDKIFPMSRIIFIADKLVDYVMPAGPNPTPKTPKEAASMVLSLHRRELKTDIAKSIHKIVGLPFKE